jgi:isopenicillin-N N-acyltransferase like protein
MHTWTGTAMQRGLQHGEELRAQIKERIRTTTPPPLAQNLDHLTATAAPWRTAIASHTPKLMQEIAGIAAGSQTTIDDIVLLNAFEAYELEDQVELGGCTAIGHTKHGRTVIGQNWDANPSLAATVDVHLHVGSDTPRLVVVASPGGLGWIGMNNHGIAVVNNDLLTKVNRPGLASQAVRRLVLDSSEFAHALEVLTNTPPVGGRSYMLGGPEGELATVELAVEHDKAVTSRHSRNAAHTNHALGAAISAHEIKRLLTITYPSSWDRLERAEMLLDEEASDIATMLTDHIDWPLSICRHPDQREPTVTAASVIFDCSDRIAHISIGNPCVTEAHTFDLSQG